MLKFAANKFVRTVDNKSEKQPGVKTAKSRHLYFNFNCDIVCSLKNKRTRLEGDHVGNKSLVSKRILSNSRLAD